MWSQFHGKKDDLIGLLGGGGRRLGATVFYTALFLAASYLWWSKGQPPISMTAIPGQVFSL